MEEDGQLSLTDFLSSDKDGKLKKRDLKKIAKSSQEKQYKPKKKKMSYTWDEHDRFLKALETHGKDYKQI